jgi:hypothetical protein
MTIKRPLQLLTGDQRTNRPIWIEHEEVDYESADPVEAWLVIGDMARLPMKLARGYALMGEWPMDVTLAEVDVILSGMAVLVPAIDAEGAVPGPAQQEQPVEVSGGEVKVDVGVQEVETAVSTGGATSQADLAEAEVSPAAVGVDAAGGLASDDAGEQHGVEQVVPGLDADKVGNGKRSRRTTKPS